MSFNSSKNTNVRPLKKFGQNFLKDKNIVDKIIAEINPVKGDLLVEIGPGMGVLTEELVKTCPDLTAVEIDRRLAEEIRQKYPSISLLEQDILKFDYSEFARRKQGAIRLVGNIPYNISSQILFRALDHRKYIKDIVFMMQFEVAQRIVSGHGNKVYGILSVVLQSVAETVLCFKVPPHVFYPKPDVDSAIIHITMKPEEPEFDFVMFKKVVKAAFGHRRKTLKNALQAGFFLPADLKESPIDLSLRAEALSIADFKILTTYLSTRIKTNAEDGLDFPVDA